MVVQQANIVANRCDCKHCSKMSVKRALSKVSGIASSCPRLHLLCSYGRLPIGDSKDKCCSWCNYLTNPTVISIASVAHMIGSCSAVSIVLSMRVYCY